MAILGMTDTRRRKRIDPLVESGFEGMRDTVSTLNPTRIKRTIKGEFSYRDLPFSDLQLALRDLVQRWMSSGPNLRVMLTQDPELAEAVRHGNTILYPTPTGRGYLDWFPRTPESHLSTEKFDFSSLEDQALRHFVLLITNPEWDRLGGPCKRCKRYFLSESRRRRVYCSRNCSSAATAIPATTKQRAKAKEEKVKLARKRIEEWKKLKTRRVTWQQWLLQDPLFTKKWITRAVNDGLI